MRYALGIEYDGSQFLGWQRLSHGRCIQTTVETALASILQTPIEVICAGRTDAGVHAACQVVHFNTDIDRPLKAFVYGTNTRLPADVRVLWAQPVSDQFSARHSARARLYRYCIINRSVRPAIGRQLFSWEPQLLDVDAMDQAAQALLGENDFSAFRTSQCQARHPIRELQRIAVQRSDDQVIIDVQANAFLHHMVRNIVGSLIPIGRGQQPPIWLSQLLAGRDRSKAGPTAPAEGLTFIGPRYPAQWGLPSSVTLSNAVSRLIQSNLDVDM